VFSKSVSVGLNLYRVRLVEELEDKRLDSWETEKLSGIIPKESFLTKETSEGLRVTLHSTIDLIEYLFSIGFVYVLTAKANQDQLE
ncbi:zinc finger MYM-type protein 1-like, partial [Aphis craccivora]